MQFTRVFPRIVTRLWLAVCVIAACLMMAMPAQAAVKVSFQSFNGSLFGRFPHTFVVFEGTLDSTGEKIHENYGFSAANIGPNVLTGPVKHMMYVEKEKYIRKTNRHFTITVSDATYFRMKKEVAAWRDAPGKYYDLDTRNCIHFVGAIAAIGGVKVDYPQELIRKPRAWLNHIVDMNSQLHGKKF